MRSGCSQLRVVDPLGRRSLPGSPTAEALLPPWSLPQEGTEMVPSRGGEPPPTAPVPQLQSSRHVFSNPWLDVREDVLLWPGASERCYGIVTVNPGVTVLALDESTGEVWCVWQYRPAIGRVSLELVGGGTEEGESPLDAAKRELAEERELPSGGGTLWECCTQGPQPSSTLKHTSSLPVI